MISHEVVVFRLLTRNFVFENFFIFCFYKNMVPSYAKASDGHGEPTRFAGAPARRVFLTDSFAVFIGAVVVFPSLYKFY